MLGVVPETVDGGDRSGKPPPQNPRAQVGWGAKRPQNPRAQVQPHDNETQRVPSMATNLKN
jgi:hypothetical protein